MKNTEKLLKQNKEWASKIEEENPSFFKQLSTAQQPEYLWIGCSDSRVPPAQLLGLLPGDVFVHRNIANLIIKTDTSSASVIQYAVDVLKIKHIIVCGHYNCGGVQAAISGTQLEQPIESWLDPIRATANKFSEELETLPEKEKFARLCELNVAEQINTLSNHPTIKNAWSRNQDLTLHGWIYNLENGTLADLHITQSNQH